MRFTLRKLGRLEEATIDLGKDLIVLTGPNNTSKTYVAHAIYGFCRLLNILVRGALRPGLAQRGDLVEVDLLATIDHAPDLLRALERDYRSTLFQVLGAPPSFTSSANITLELDKQATERARLAVLNEERHEVLTPGLGPALDEQILLDKSSGNGVWTATRMVRGPVTRSSTERSAVALSNLLLVHAAAGLVRALWGGLANARIFIAERAAVEVFSPELAARSAELRHDGERPSPYPLALSDSLKSVYQLRDDERQTSPFYTEADRLEHEVLQGSVRVGPHGQLLFGPADTAEQLDMNLASSSVKALADLSFYLRHLAQKGDLLIIDEPEVNLHPDNQRRVARLLARLARSGIKVMISTHSDHIIRELNTLIMLSSDVEGKLLEEFGYGREETLDPVQVGAYLFTPTRAEQVPVEPTGFDAKTIDAEIVRENRSSQRIYFALFDK
jgi:AAA domain, putative AbiEii toxin, Type IV TA system